MSYSLKQKARLYQTLYTGMKAGLDLQLMLTGEVLPAVFLPRLREVVSATNQGKPLRAALATAGIVSPWEAGMLAIGESAGRLELVIAELRTFVVTRKARISADVRHVVKKLSLWFYVALMLIGSGLIQAAMV